MNRGFTGFFVFQESLNFLNIFRISSLLRHVEMMGFGGTEDKKIRHVIGILLKMTCLTIVLIYTGRFAQLNSHFVFAKVRERPA